MTTSILCHKVRICKLIDTLDETKCLDVLQLLRDELKYGSLNRLLIKMIFDAQDTLTIDSLDSIEKYVHQIGAKDGNSKQISPGKGKTQMKDKNDSKNRTCTIFPLLRLPIDLIANTSLFLNEQNIIKFEQCCRMFYEMINNTSYLNKCNNFKTFEITEKRLRQICDSKCNLIFYKYCKAHILKCEFCKSDSYRHLTDEDLANILLNEHEPLWNKAYTQMTSLNSHNNWYINLMESIRLIQFNPFSSLMIDKILPVDILFDGKRSQLEGICLDHHYDGLKSWNQCINTFEKNYVNFRNELKQRGEKIKTLEFVNHTNTSRHRMMITGPQYIEAKYVWFNHMTINAVGNMSFSTYGDLYGFHSYPQLKMITFTNGILIKNDNVTGGCCNKNLNIETMRLIDFGCKLNASENASICNNKQLIESWNLHNSLKNLTITISLLNNRQNFTRRDDEKIEDAWKQWLLAIKNILTKEYYFNLENVNILIYDIYGNNCSRAIGIFQILKENKSVLKHQFKQLNVAFHMGDCCYIIKWTHGMNDILLDQIKSDIRQYVAWVCSYPRNIEIQPKQIPSDETLKEYQLLQEQWVPRHFQQFSSPDKLLK